ncbi:MAG: hypothetical protein FJ271_05800 [Planctomycetes bacterium]|nr:hypothetical protein [Planctomycetota bacterium]
MTLILIRKLLRDVRVWLLVVALLLGVFQCLWARVTHNISMQLLPFLDSQLVQGVEALLRTLFQEGPAKLVQTLIGGETIDLRRPMDMLSIGYVHPFTQTILCFWGIGRAAGAIAGEIDRGTMELLLAQPLSRGRLLLAHLCVDLVAIPILCLSMWTGTLVGTSVFGLADEPVAALRADPARFAPALVNVAVMVFAVSGATMVLSAAGRFRNRVLGIAILLFLFQFLINLVGQLWSAAEALRPLTLFYYYQPQAIILDQHWVERGMIWLRLAVLLAVGSAGYVLAWRIFTRRDLPVPL